MLKQLLLENIKPQTIKSINKNKRVFRPPRTLSKNEIELKQTKANVLRNQCFRGPHTLIRSLETQRVEVQVQVQECWPRCKKMLTHFKQYQDIHSCYEYDYTVRYPTRLSRRLRKNFNEIFVSFLFMRQKETTELSRF